MTGIILLAAGASTRLGEPKQALLFRGKTLLQQAIQVARDSMCNPVTVVLGAHPVAALTEPAHPALAVVHNHAWHEGMASSIRAGLECLLTMEPALPSCIFMVCDQPYVTADVLNALIEHRQAGTNRIVASAYGNTLGTPVLFDQAFFPELLALQGQEGAKKVILKYPADVKAVPFPLGGIDIDTADDYTRLLRQDALD
jgi:molybdenum cofactor cytidylyltransferase